MPPNQQSFTGKLHSGKGSSSADFLSTPQALPANPAVAAKPNTETAEKPVTVLP